MNTIQFISKALFFTLLISLSISSCATKKTVATPKETKTEDDTPRIMEIPDGVLEEEEIMEEVSPPPPPPPPPPSHREIFKVVEQMPRFPGCENLMINEQGKKECAQEKLVEFVYSNLNYPAIAKENGVEGTCVVTFVIERDGRLNDIRLVRDIGAGCGQEAVRVITSMNEQGIAWIPGKQRGRPVAVQFNMPVKFRLPEDD